MHSTDPDGAGEVRLDLFVNSVFFLSDIHLIQILDTFLTRSDQNPNHKSGKPRDTSPAESEHLIGDGATQ